MTGNALPVPPLWDCTLRQVISSGSRSEFSSIRVQSPFNECIPRYYTFITLGLNSKQMLRDFYLSGMTILHTIDLKLKALRKLN